MPKLNNLIGQRFGQLTVIDRTEDYISPKGKHLVQWVCRCDCGEIVVRTASNIHRHTHQSCDKHREYKQKHGDTSLSNNGYTRLYAIWSSMKQRTLNPNNNSYPNYGGRGIHVCQEWSHDYAAFKDWALSHGYKEDLTLERIDNNGDYSPQNCRWATRSEQAHNKRTNCFLTAKGVTKTITEWSRETGIPLTTLRRKVHNDPNWLIDWIEMYREWKA